MEVLQTEVTKENWDEWNKLKEEREGAECGGPLDVRTVPARKTLEFGCMLHPTAGYRQRTSFTEDFRRGEAVPLVIQNKIEQKMMDETEFRRAVQLLAVRFPGTIHSGATAALFINDCMRLGLDPLIQPPEAGPVVFKTRDRNTGKEKSVVAMIINEDGALAMGA